MKYKLFGMSWDLKPVFIFIWLCIMIALFCGFLVYAFEDKPIVAIAYSLGCFLWAYINHTLEANGKLNDHRPANYRPSR